MPLAALYTVRVFMPAIRIRDKYMVKIQKL